MKRASKPQRTAKKAALRGRGIKPGKIAKANPRGQATGGWSPFAPPAGRMDVADDVEYEAYDRVRRGWFTNKGER